MNNIGDILQAMMPVLPDNQKRSPQHELEALGKELGDFFGKRHRGQVWKLIRGTEYSLDQIREAWYSFQKGKVKTFPYYMGILKRLKK